jgi:hypothetical protein
VSAFTFICRETVRLWEIRKKLQSTKLFGALEMSEALEALIKEELCR